MKKLNYIYNFLSIHFYKILHRELSDAYQVDSHLTLKEKTKLYSLSKNKDFIAEIGSYTGASACCFGASTNGKIICIDTWNNNAMSEGKRDTWLEFKKNTSNYSDSIIAIRGYSQDVIEEVKNITKKLDILFIDGDHSYESVKSDWENYKQLLKPEAIVIFHDYGWAEGVKRVVHEDVKIQTYAHGSLPNMWWGTVKEIT